MGGGCAVKITIETDDCAEAMRMMNAQVMFDCLDEIRRCVRSHQKHGKAEDADRVLADIFTDANATLEVME